MELAIDDYPNINNDVETPNISELDDQWIEEFEAQEQLYNTFYNEDIPTIRFYYVYMNKDKTIEMIRQETRLLSIPNTISKEELVGILKTNNTLHNCAYALHSMFKYNFALPSSDIMKYLKTESEPDYFSPLTTLDPIVFEKTITMMQDLNDVYVFYIKKEKPQTISQTRRIVFSNTTKPVKTFTRKNR